MNIEAQLLQIIEQHQEQSKQQQQLIEQQQEQLKQQQQLIEQKCEQLNLVQEQLNKTLKEQEKLLNALENLDQYTSRHKDSLTAHFNRVEEKLKSLENQALPEKFLNNLQQNLQQHLQKLVTNLNIENEAEILPRLVQAEIEKQTAPLAEKINQKLDSVQQYQEKLQVLIQQVSSRL